MICLDDLTTYPSKPHGHDRWAHLYDDQGDVEALHAFARLIGLRRVWFQPSRSLQHYDVVASKHQLAISAGATLVDRQTFARHVLAAVERYAAQKLA